MPPKSVVGRGGFSRNTAPSRSSPKTSNGGKGTRGNNSSILNFFRKAPGPPENDQSRITQFLSRNKQQNAVTSASSSAVDETTSGGLFFDSGAQIAGSLSDENDGEIGDNDSLFGGSALARSQQLSRQQDYVETGGQNGEERYYENDTAVKRRRLSPVVYDDCDHEYVKPTIPEVKQPPSEIAGRRRIGPFVDYSDDDDNDDEVPPVNLTVPKEGRVGNPGNFTPIVNDPFPPPLVPREEQEQQTTCPICEASLGDMTDLEASEHVNQCLDATMSPARPTVASMAIGEASDAQSSSEPAITPDSSNMHTPKDPLIERHAKSGQQNPFAIEAAANPAKLSAFSRMMTENVEASAWATAAAREVASRGKRAFERTCPFYKILPNFAICIDAFRYGAVEGCEAYFLSHFHSDHYIGLTKTWCNGPIYCSQVTANLVIQQLGVNQSWVRPIPFDITVDVPGTQGAKVTMLEANHCPGSSIFLFEKEINGRNQRLLHCGDFRAHPKQVLHPKLAPEVKDPSTGKFLLQKLDAVYLDTTYLNPKYSFPNQEDVIQTCAAICVKLNRGEPLDAARSASSLHMSKFVSRESSNTSKSTASPTPAKPAAIANANNQNGSRLCVVIGTYSIGKERICLGIARALDSKIYASAYKQRITRALNDPDLTSRLTSNPYEAQVHMHSLMEIRPAALSDYLTTLKPHFSRIVGFRPTGWTYRPPKGRMLENPDVGKVIYSEGWRTPFGEKDCKPQRGSTEETACFGIPYSEHSSFRELTMFCCSLRIGRVVPTVNVGSATSRDRMKKWVERWEAYKRSNGLYIVKEGTMRW
ncbi:hypothetical protein KEM54_001979 [Ascosphaera aggregata]|nr:hypothetical protein KEM54_001979 [Ascosphaera aggregata]